MLLQRPGFFRATHSCAQTVMLAVESRPAERYLGL